MPHHMPFVRQRNTGMQKARGEGWAELREARMQARHLVAEQGVGLQGYTEGACAEERKHLQQGKHCACKVGPRAE